MLKLMDKKIFTILRSKSLLNRTYDMIVNLFSDTLKELFLTDILPDDRKLLYFKQVTAIFPQYKINV